MKKNIISTNKAPAAIGTYSQAVVISGAKVAYLSGQIPLIPQTMQVVSNDVAEQINQVFKNLEQLTIQTGGSLDNIVKLTIYLTDLSNFSMVNKIMATFFNEPYPARAVVEVAKLPKEVLIEIDAIAVLD